MTKRFLRGPAMGLAVLALAACGGGGGGSDPAPITTLSLSGTAATGAAMAGASVEIKCATGTGSATTAANGSFSATVTGGVLPCLLRATSADGLTVLHSVAPGTGASNASIGANITPITELVVARALGSASTATAFTSFPTTLQTQLTSTAVTAALDAIKAALTTIAPALSNINPLSQSFVAANGANGGDAADQAIDLIMAQLAAAAPNATGITAQVATLAEVLATAPAADLGTATSSFVAPPVAGCTALRSVPYRIVGLFGGFGKTTSLDWAAGTLNTTWNDGSTESGSLTFNNTQACQFAMTTSNGSVEGYTASSGVVALRDQGSPSSKAGVGLAFPEQRLAVADLAGTWNFLEFSTDDTANGPFTNFQGMITLDSTGKFTADMDCSGTTTSSQACTASPAEEVPSNIAVDPDGGFHLVDRAGKTVEGVRMFAFRNAAGKTMLVVSFPNGGLIIGAQQANSALPTAGSSSTFWDLQAYQSSGPGLVTTADTATVTIQSVDAATQRVTRIRDTLNGQADGRVDVVNFNQPRTGLRFRPSGTYVLNSVTKNFANTVQMPIQGMGMTFAISPGPSGNGSKYLSISVTQ